MTKLRTYIANITLAGALAGGIGYGSYEYGKYTQRVANEQRLDALAERFDQMNVPGEARILQGCVYGVGTNSRPNLRVELCERTATGIAYSAAQYVRAFKQRYGNRRYPRVGPWHARWNSAQYRFTHQRGVAVNRLGIVGLLAASLVSAESRPVLYSSCEERTTAKDALGKTSTWFLCAEVSRDRVQGYLVHVRSITERGVPYSNKLIRVENEVLDMYTYPNGTPRYVTAADQYDSDALGVAKRTVKQYIRKHVMNEP